MTSTLPQPLLAELSAFLQRDALFAFDYDGVLAPIVPVRDAAHIGPVTRRLLRDVAGRYACIVVSGRPLADLTPRVHDIPLRMVFGNFGHEPPAPGEGPPPQVTKWVGVLRARLQAEQGLFVEDKRYSVAVHYRHAANETDARRLIDEAVRDLSDVRVLEGTKAVTLLPSDGPHKGSTVHSARTALRRDYVVYVGDDGTDEDGFRLDTPERLLAIKIGRTARTAARFILPDQSDIDRLLEAVLLMSTHGISPHALREAPRS